MPASKKITTNTKAFQKKVLLSAPVYSILGRSTGVVELPKDVFGAEINRVLLTQAIRVYLNNQKSHFANTLGRGQVHGTTAKMYKQKGTGRARHGAKTAPLFVGGGVAHGPKYRKVVLDLPQKMRSKALISALSAKAKEGSIKIISGLNKASGKTKEMAALLKRLNHKDSLLVCEGEIIQRAARNISNTKIVSPKQLNVYEVIEHQALIMSKESLEVLNNRLGVKNA